MTHVLFILGFPLLLGGAYAMVKGSASLALRFGISELVVGLTIVAMGTSAPELIVSLLAATKGNPDLAMGNVIGSNISNTLLILGVAALVSPLKMQTSLRWREIPFVLLSSLVLLAIVNDHFLTGRSLTGLDRIDGIVLLSIFLIYLYYLFSISKKTDTEAVEKVAPVSIPMALAMVLGGIVGLALGGQWLVDGASAIAESFGMSRALIGLTIVAIGTSLPELATSIMAAYQKNADIAVGNVVGSNIFNILWILGASSVIHPIHFNPLLNGDVLFLLVITLFLFLFTFTGKKHEIDRIEGGIFLVGYIGYISFIVVRG